MGSEMCIRDRDDAFLRRLRFIIPFPFPQASERSNLWQRLLPEKAPVGQIDFDKLARLTLAGGAIRNIVLHAAFKAAEASSNITMSLLLEATRGEYSKAEKTLDESLVSDWC